MANSSTARLRGGGATAAAVAIGYAVAGALWIFFSDRALDALLGDRPHLLSEVQTLKGWIFVGASAGVLYVVLLRLMRARRRAAAIMSHRFTALTDSLPEHSVAMLDADGRVQSWSDGSIRTTGYRADEMIGQTLARLFVAEDAAKGELASLLARAGTQGKVEIEGWRVRKDGSRYWASGIVTAIRDDDGAVLGFANVARDVTRRRKTLEALQASEARLRDFVESGTDWFWETDADLRFTYISDRFEATTGVRREQWEGRRRDEVPVVVRRQGKCCAADGAHAPAPLVPQRAVQLHRPARARPHGAGERQAGLRRNRRLHRLSRRRRRRHGRQGDRGAAPPVAEDGGGRPAHRRHRARLQQPARGHLRQPRAAGRASRRRTASCAQLAARGAERVASAAPS